MKLDGETIQELYRTKILSQSDLKKINIINALELGTPNSVVARRFGVSRQYVAQINKKCKPNG